MTVKFDSGVKPFAPIAGALVIARFTTSRPLAASEISFNPAVGIEPDIQEWAEFDMNGYKPSLDKRMVMTERYMRNHLENMAHHERHPAGRIPHVRSTGTTATVVRRHHRVAQQLRRRCLRVAVLP